MRRHVTPAPERELLREYPIGGLVEDWFFRVEEQSPGHFLVEGTDRWGRLISGSAPGDPEATLRECVVEAQNISRSSARHR